MPFDVEYMYVKKKNAICNGFIFNIAGVKLGKGSVFFFFFLIFLLTLNAIPVGEVGSRDEKHQ